MIGVIAMRYGIKLAILASLASSVGFVVGCGGAPAPVAAIDPSVKDKAELKSRLDGIAETGNAGSALAGMRQEIEKVGDKSLAADMDQLEKAQNPDAVKQIAKRMSDKLK